MLHVYRSMSMHSTSRDSTLCVRAHICPCVLFKCWADETYLSVFDMQYMYCAYSTVLLRACFLTYVCMHQGIFVNAYGRVP